MVRKAREDGYCVVLAIFLHQRQFAPGENVALYPRDPERDLDVARECAADVLWDVREEDAYPPGFATELLQRGLERTLSGVIHPEVLRIQLTTSVRLLNILGARSAYFGELDSYKALALRQTLSDLALPAEVRLAPTARETDGLAYSSLNVNLYPEERRNATQIYSTLREAQRLFAKEGETEVTRLLGRTSAALTRIPGFRLQYVRLLDPTTLLERTHAHLGDIVMTGGYFGRTRLSDAVHLD